MDFRRMLNENWPYKTAAVVLSILMWLSVSCPSEMVVGATGGTTEVKRTHPSKTYSGLYTNGTTEPFPIEALTGPARSNAGRCRAWAEPLNFRFDA